MNPYTNQVWCFSPVLSVTVLVELGGRKITNLRLAWAKLGRLSEKQDANKRTKGMARVVEFWP
jgi:hypothetical protein